jgi:hypothetical protein
VKEGNLLNALENFTDREEHIEEPSVPMAYNKRIKKKGVLFADSKNVVTTQVRKV